jgi:DNA-binding transcriptional ArsR family regulator
LIGRSLRIDKHQFNRYLYIDDHRSGAGVRELVPLFDVAQPTVSHHLKVLRQAGVVGSEREGLWDYYYACDGSGRYLSRDGARPVAGQ